MYSSRVREYFFKKSLGVSPENGSMLKHIGAGYLVREEDIVGYFDLDGKVDAAVTKEFLKNAEKLGRCDIAGEDLPRSFVLTSKKKSSVRSRSEGEQMSDEKVIFTHISTQALKKR